MATVETALGPVEGSELGFTLSHEHVITSSGEDMSHYPWLYDLEATEAQVIAELSEAKAGGVDTIIDLTTPDLGRDVERVARIAEASGMHVVVATGMWRDVPRSFWSRDPDTIADIFVREIDEGIGHTSIKAGAIKGGERRRRRHARGGACAARRCACREAHRRADQHPSLGAAGGWTAAGRTLPRGGGADGSRVHWSLR